MLTAISAILAIAQPQCSGGGEPSCPCISNYPGRGGDEKLVLSIDNTHRTYEDGYGLHSCLPHDADAAPFCNEAGFPSWCSYSWCYVNASNCALSAKPSLFVPGMHYSYKTCGVHTDTFNSFYTHRDGVVNLCSVFALTEAADGNKRACGRTNTLAQVEAAAKALNTLNNGRGFSTYELSRVTRYYRFNYTVRTYPSGQWATVGRQMSADLFASDACDLVIGQANGCPDAEITAQALLANASSRIYVTGRGPQAVLRQHGDNQPYLFSSHLRSDLYATHSINEYYNRGARSMAIVHEEDSDDVFYSGLSRYTLQYAAARGFEVRYNATIDGSVDLTKLETRLTEAHETRADVLVLVLAEAHFKRALKALKAMRVWSKHRYKALWWQGVPWGNGTCQGLAEECEYAVGATQMSTEQALRGYTDPLLGITYEELKQMHMAEEKSSFDFPDGSMIPSMVAQAMQTVFRFREMALPKRPLGSSLDNELLREFLRSGDLVATTFNGPVRFNEYGQNVGRDSTTLQMRDGVARVVLPAALEANEGYTFNYPAPAFTDCQDAHERKYDSEADCLLCAASTCATSTWWGRSGTLVGSAVGGLTGVMILAVVARLLHRHHQQYRQQLRAKWYQRKADLTRVKNAVKKVANLDFYVCFVRFEDFQAHGRLIRHEVVRANNQLIVLDTFDDVKSFIDLNQVAFISHQWLAGRHPDPEGVHFQAIVDAVRALQRKLIQDDNSKAKAPLYLWLDYISIPQANKSLQSLSISSLALYASMPDYFVVVAPPATHVDTGPCNKETYLRRGWCRLEQWARMTVGGTDDMANYLWDGALRSLSSQDEFGEWLNHAIRVFEGDFSDLSDLHKIVDSCLGLWATAYYTHRIIAGAGVIKPLRNRKSSLRFTSPIHQSTCSAHIARVLGFTTGPVKSGARKPKAIPRRLSGSECAKIHPDVVPNQLKPSAGAHHIENEIMRPRAAVTYPLGSMAAAPTPAALLRAKHPAPSLSWRRASVEPDGSEESFKTRSLWNHARLGIGIANDIATTGPKHSLRNVSWRTDDSGTTGGRCTSTKSLHSQRNSQRQQESQRDSSRKNRSDSEVETIALKASNTIYDIVSLRKGAVFPPKYFGDLVELLEWGIDEGKIVPILRSRRNKELVEKSLSPDTALSRRLTRTSTSGRVARETEWPVAWQSSSVSSTTLSLKGEGGG